MDAITALQKIISNVELVMMDKRRAVELTVITLICQGHLLIEDVPGVGKTSLASALARSLGCSFHRIQFTPDIMPSDITGFSMYNPKDNQFEYHPGSIFSQIILADEINRTSPKTQSSLLEAMEEKQTTVDGKTYLLPQPFFVLATQNPVEYLGTYPLPEAQMDRFLMRISIGYPSRIEETRMLARFAESNPLKKLAPVASAEMILALQKMVQTIHVDRSIAEYIVNIVNSTRNNPLVSLGVSPRGSIALYRASQAWALYQGRNYVIPDDVMEMSEYVLSHRILLSQDAKLKKISQQEIIAQAIQANRVPVNSH